jgi:micrococcal nuclease
MVRQRLLIAVVITSSLCVSGLDGAPPKKPKGAGNPPNASHSNPPRSTGGGGRLPSAPGMQRPTVPGGGGANSAVGSARHVDPNHSLRTALLSRTSNVQQQLHTAEHWHHWHHLHYPWRWGATVYVPTATAAGWVTGVPSGNTLSVLNAGNLPQRVRMFGVASPMPNQAFFSVSQEHLADLANQKYVNVYQVGTDPDGTMVAQVFLRDSSAYLNYRQIRDGMAWNLADDGFAPDLASAEEDAQARRAGLWADDDPTAPWIYADE